MNIFALRLSVSRVWGKWKPGLYFCLSPWSAGVVGRLQGGVGRRGEKLQWFLETLWDGMPHPRITLSHPSQSRDSGREDQSAVEYKVRKGRGWGGSGMSVCTWLGGCGLWLWKAFWLLRVRTTLFGLPKRSTVAELLHIAYDSDNDSAHIGIILPCEVFAPSLLNMHECLKWILEDFHPPLSCPLPYIVKLSNHIPVY